MGIKEKPISNTNLISYMITFCPSLYRSLDNFYWGGREDQKDIKYSRIEELLIKDLYESGTKVYLEDCELYVKKYKFDTTLSTTNSFHEEQDINFKTIFDDDLWNYILGQFFKKGKLGFGFGVTKVETI